MCGLQIVEKKTKRFITTTAAGTAGEKNKNINIDLKHGFAEFFQLIKIKIQKVD